MPRLWLLGLILRSNQTLAHSKDAPSPILIYKYIHSIYYYLLFLIHFNVARESYCQFSAPSPCCCNLPHFPPVFPFLLHFSYTPAGLYLVMLCIRKMKRGAAYKNTVATEASNRKCSRPCAPHICCLLSTLAVASLFLLFPLLISVTLNSSLSNCPLKELKLAHSSCIPTFFSFLPLLFRILLISLEKDFSNCHDSIVHSHIYEEAVALGGSSCICGSKRCSLGRSTLTPTSTGLEASPRLTRD